MSITNLSKPTTSITNSSKISHEETWDTNTTTWDTETRAWNDMGSKVTNSTLGTSSLWNYRSFPWQLSSPWTNSNSGITNLNKP